MKKTMAITVMALWMHISVQAQGDYPQQLQSAVATLDKATTATAYEQLATTFSKLATAKPADWLPWYYAAYCNAKLGWLYQDDGEKIEPYANKADEQIGKAKGLLDTATQTKELSEVYAVLSMINRAKVFINPMTYGRQYGPAASNYVRLSLKANATNPRALYLDGWEKYATPKMWGGDKKKAKELLQQAAGLFGSDAPGSAPHWGKPETDALLAKLK